MKTQKNFALLFILPILFTITTILMLNGNFKAIDGFFHEFLRNNITQAKTAIAIALSFIGSYKFYILITILFLFIKINSQRFGLLFGIVCGCSFLVNTVLKNQIQRTRPNIPWLEHASSYSYPSGHSMVSMSVFIFMAFVIYKNTSSIKLKKLIIVFAPLLSISIAFSRIYLGVHFFSDCLAGLILGTLTGLLFCKLYTHKKLNFLILK